MKLSSPFTHSESPRDRKNIWWGVTGVSFSLTGMVLSVLLSTTIGTWPTVGLLLVFGVALGLNTLYLTEHVLNHITMLVELNARRAAANILNELDQMK